VPADQQDLLPALSFLLRSRAMASALAQPSGSDDGRLSARLLAEIQAQYSPAICQRLQGVIAGLVGQAAQPAAAPPCPQAAATAAPPPVGMPAVSTLVSPGGGSSWVVALLCFLIGILGSGLLLVVWLQQQNRPPAGVGSAVPAVPATPAPSPATATAPPPPAIPAPQPAGTEALNAAVTSIQDLYSALSNKDYASASRYYGPAAADQFDATFFNQFERVTLSDLRQTSSTGSIINLEGVVSFVYSNGDVQTETRTFTVDTRTAPASITSSEFGRVLQPR
jgi:hypothetical protein